MATNPFIMIPVPMIRRLMETPNAYNELLAYGLYKSARKQRTSFENGALRQLVYSYYREREALTVSLCSRLDSDEDFLNDAEAAFNGDTFNADFEIGELIEMCEKDKDFKEEIWEWYDLYQFCELTGYHKKGIAVMILFRNKFSSYDDEPYAMINPKVIEKYRERTKERDRVRLAMLLSMQSVVGKARFKCTTKNQVTMRMFGAKNANQLDEVLKDANMKMMYDQYTTRKMYDGMRDELLKMKLIKCYYGYSGRAYISIKHELKDIVNEVADFVIASKNKVTSHEENDQLFKEALNKKLTALNKRTS